MRELRDRQEQTEEVGIRTRLYVGNQRQFHENLQVYDSAIGGFTRGRPASRTKSPNKPSEAKGVIEVQK